MQIRSFTWLKKNKNSLFKPISNSNIKKYNKSRNYGTKPILCYAPFRALQFNQSGHILVCCYNKIFNLGKYPEVTIKQAWQGNKLKKLRKYISNNDLRLGCQLCQRNIISGRYSAADANNYDYDVIENWEYPDMILFELSNVCNLECIMCSGSRSSSIKKDCSETNITSLKYGHDFILELEEFFPYLKYANFSGGEPFLINMYFDIWERLLAINSKVEINVTTNGLIWNERIRQVLLKGKFNIRISLDSIRKDTYEKIRKNGSFEVVQRNIINFQKYCQDNGNYFQINAQPMRQNWWEIPEIYEYGIKNNIPVKTGTVYFPPSCALWNLSPENIFQIIKEYKKFRFSLSETYIQKENILRFQKLISQLKVFYKNSIELSINRINLKSKSSETLKELLIARLTNIIKDDCFDNDLIINNTNDISRNLDYMFCEITDSEEIKKAYINLIELPPEILLAEMEVRNIEELIDFANQVR